MTFYKFRRVVLYILFWTWNNFHLCIYVENLFTDHNINKIFLLSNYFKFEVTTYSVQVPVYITHQPVIVISYSWQYCFGHNLSSNQYSCFYKKIFVHLAILRWVPLDRNVLLSNVMNLRKSFMETFQMIWIASQRAVLSRSKYHEWFRRFKRGQQSV